MFLHAISFLLSFEKKKKEEEKGKGKRERKKERNYQKRNFIIKMFIFE